MSNTISSANKIKELREIIKIQKELIDGLNREIEVRKQLKKHDRKIIKLLKGEV